MGTARLAAISDYLLALYARAADADAASYSAFALEGFCALMGVERAWWGLMSQDNSVPRLLSSVRHGLPAHYEAAWEAVRRDDIVAKAVIEVKYRVTSLDAAQIPPDSALRGFASEFDLSRTLCLSVDVSDQDTLMFISSYRRHGEPRFTTTDRSVNGLLVPHLRAAWMQNLRERLRPDQEGAPHSARKAFVDRHGRLCQCEDGFEDLVAKQWRRWRGHSLPAPLIAAVEQARVAPGRRWEERAWAVKAIPAGLLTLIEFREASPLDRLSPREREVAVLFARGLTHKEIARETNLMPTTVRHYLREVYAKLLVDNKAALTGLLYSRCAR